MGTFKIGRATWKDGPACVLCGQCLRPDESGLYCECPTPPEEQAAYGETMTLVWHLPCAAKLSRELTDALGTPTAREQRP